MRILRHISFSIVLACMAFPAMAETQSPYKGGMHNIINQPPEKTTGPKAPEQKAPAVPIATPVESTGGIKRLVISKEPEEAPEKNEEAEQTRIWNRYKALAAGTADENVKKTDEDKSAEAETKEKTDTDKAAPVESVEKAEAAPPAPENGFSRILEKYEQNKARQSQMRTIQMGSNKEPADDSADDEKKPETP